VFCRRILKSPSNLWRKLFFVLLRHRNGFVSLLCHVTKKDRKNMEKKKSANKKMKEDGKEKGATTFACLIFIFHLSPSNFIIF